MSLALVVAVDDTWVVDDWVPCFWVRHDGASNRVDGRERTVRIVMSVCFMMAWFNV